ncbi:MAG: serine protease [Bradyrhizobium sp.]|nr:MAG: serine protease [Bradyrhizobium sp.]
MSNPAPTSSLQTLSDALSDVVADAVKSVVAVHSTRSRSSGFVWRPGLIVTADEALADEGEIAVMSPGGEAVTATLVGRDSTTDIALLRADGFTAPVASLAPAPAKAGALALAVGAGRNGPIAAFGVVSSAGPAWRSLRGGEIDARVELNLSLRRAAEGGLALDASGRAFGMAVFGPRQTVLVIPAATIDLVAGKLQTHGRIARGYIGLGLQAAKLDGDGGIGAMVMSVDPTGPGSAAGVRQGDLIVKWKGECIRDVRALLRALGPDSVGQTAKLSLLRGGEPIEVALTTGERPDS